MNDLVRRLGLAQPQVSKHLRVLREVGRSTVRGDGPSRLYRLNGQALKPIHDWVSAYERPWAERFDALDVVLDELKERRRDDDDDQVAATATVTLAERHADPDHARVRRAAGSRLQGLDDAGARSALVARRTAAR